MARARPRLRVSLTLALCGLARLARASICGLSVSLSGGSALTCASNDVSTNFVGSTGGGWIAAVRSGSDASRALSGSTQSWSTVRDYAGPQIWLSAGRSSAWSASRRTSDPELNRPAVNFPPDLAIDIWAFVGERGCVVYSAVSLRSGIPGCAGESLPSGAMTYVKPAGGSAPGRSPAAQPEPEPASEADPEPEPDVASPQSPVTPAPTRAAIACVDERLLCPPS